MPGPWSATVTEAVPGVRSKVSATVPPVGRMADRIADQVDEDLDDRRVPRRSRGSGSARSSSIVDARAPRPSDSSITTASAASAARSIVSLALRRLLAHRANDRQQVPRGGRDVVAIARIVAAQRPVGALDDPLGAFDDPVERRAQRFVERMVEAAVRAGRGRRRRRRSISAVPRKPAKLPSAPVTTSPLRITTARFVGAAARALAGEAAARGERADQRHFAVFVLLEPEHARQRLPGRFGDVDAEMLGKVGRQRDRAAAPRRRPIRCASCAASASAAAAEQRGEPRRRGRPLGPAFERQRDLVAFRRRARPTARCHGRPTPRAPGARPAMPSLRASSRDRRDLRQGQASAERRAGLALQRFELRIGRDQPAGLVEPAEDRPRFRGSAGHWPSPALRRPRDRPGSAASQLRAAATSLIAQRVERADRRPGSSIPSRSPIAASKPAASLARHAGRSGAGHRSAGGSPTAARPARLRRRCRAARERLGDEGHLAFDRRARRSARRSARLPRRAAATSVAVSALDAAARVMTRRARRTAAAESDRSLPAEPTSAASSRAQRRGDGMDQRRGRRPAARSSKCEQALAEAVAAAAAREDQRHRRGRDRAVVVADQPLEHPRLAPPAARPGRGRDPLLVGAAQQQPRSGRHGRAARRRSARRSAPDCRRRWPRATPLGRRARSSSAMSPTRQWSIAVISARSCSVRRSPDRGRNRRGRWPAGRAPRGARARPRRLQRQRSAIPPASSRRRLSDFG